MAFDNETLAGNLRANRARVRMSQNEVAKAIGVSEASVNNWENALYIPGVDSIYALADLYHTSIDQLAGFSA